MKEKELRKHAKCSECGKGIGHTGIPLFWTVKAVRWGLKADALRRQQGLTMMMGNAALAAAMGPDEDLAEKVTSHDITLCEECAFPIMKLFST